jgi:ketosteroid isomerase-like protein
LDNDVLYLDDVGCVSLIFDPFPLPSKPATFEYIIQAMKNLLLLLLISAIVASSLKAQQQAPTDKQKKDITALIDKYSLARENKDTVLLKNILTADVDQLVSSGEWRDGVNASVKGMLRSSAASPGTRTLTVDKIRLFNPTTAIVDCKYEIQNADGTQRKMWSTFVVVLDKKTWKISAIRNMLPSAQ